jgi:hypothetical protein
VVKDVSSQISVELGADYHRALTDGKDLEFFVVHMGVIRRF